MNITSAKFLADLNNSNSTIKATIDGQEMFVPINEANRHYSAILKWVAEGNTIAEAE